MRATWTTDAAIVVTKDLRASPSLNLTNQAAGHALKTLL
jgi:hypothetical protein